MLESTDMFASVDWKKLRHETMENGGIVVPNMLQPHTMEAINEEIAPWIKQINFNEIYGSSIVGDNRWIYHLGIASGTSLKVALDERILDLMDSIFGEPAVLSEFSFQEKIEASPAHLKMHSDRTGGMIIFFYLSGVDAELGATRFIPGTHRFGNDFPSKSPPFVDQEALAPRMKDVVAVSGGPGTALIFDQDIWHDLPPVQKAGRKTIWCLYQPSSRAPRYGVDHLYRQSNLAELNPRQLAAFGIGSPAFARAGSFRHVGTPFNKGHLKFVAKYLMRFGYFGRPIPYIKEDRLEVPSRIRAPL
jgi:Phytanoyl-CoA dioxygenase (PhyH)